MSTRTTGSPNSPSTAPTTPTTPTSPRSGPALRAVRRNGLEALRRSLAETSRLSRIILGVNLLTIVSQVTVTGIVLGFTAHQSCDWRVRFYLIAYVVRCILLAPVVVHQNLRPPTTRANRINNSSNNNGTPPGALEEGRSTSSSPDDTNATSQTVETALEGSTLATSNINTKVDRVKSFLDFAGTFLFVIGNFILFDKPEMCARNAPALYYLMVTWIILDYIVILIPVILCGAIIFCLPWVLVIMRIFRIGQAAGMGAEEVEIQKLPTVIYRARRSNDEHGNLPTTTLAGGFNSADSLSPSEDDSGEAVPLHRPKKPWWKSWRVFGRLWKAKKSTTGVSPGDNLKENELMLEDDDAVCVICLGEYEDGVELRNLLCGHHFHIGCVDEWLRINRTCPLCKRDINVDPNATEHNESDATSITPLINQPSSPPSVEPPISGEGVGSSRGPSDVVPFPEEEIRMHGGFSSSNVWNTRSDHST